jgi:glycosyltransferase involved in cell wall biosynthesis
VNGLHVAFYMQDLSGGGVERMRLALIDELRARRVAVSLVLGVARGPLMAVLPADLSVVVLEAPQTWRAILPLRRYLRRARPDILVSSLDHNNIAAILAVALARVRTRAIICQHNALSAERALGWRYRAVPWLYRLLQPLAHGIVAVSIGVADDLSAIAGIPRRRVTPIYNPVVGPAVFEPRADAPCHPWLERTSCPVFLFAGRLSAQKDPALVLHALALLRRRCPARLIMLGEGPLLAALRARAEFLGVSDDVDFVGFQTDPLPWIRGADVLVSCSRYEGLGNIIIEALACGTPVIATDCPHGPAEILQDGAYGRLVPVGDPVALALAMEEELASVPDRARLRQRAGAFTVKACADAHMDLFDAVRREGEGSASFLKKRSKKLFTMLLRI